MENIYCFEDLDKTLRDILRDRYENSLDMPFEGLTIICGGDFKQILPVIPNGTRADIVDASLNSSHLWPFFPIYELKENMRLTCGKVIDNKKELIKLPPDVCIPPSHNHVESIVDAVYPSLLQKYNDHTYLKERAILTPKNEMVHELNNKIMKMIPGEGRTYYSSNNVCKASVNTTEEDILYPT
ncbi:hypothetical protein KY290_001086 [Solanum tuberosum]|uniref:ATP-dependent DNA helicase n=1 Tax=Solanum tuberosum TaxID=4113 RepID=A0ABQ7WLA9_SOLTU|nr:hypothetical protein KY290_001086 [Solanum tuberosum]